MTEICDLSRRGWGVLVIGIVLMLSACAAPRSPSGRQTIILTPGMVGNALPVAAASEPSPTPTAVFVATPLPVPPTATLAPLPTATAQPQAASHTVQPGETLLQLAMDYGVPMGAIQKENGMGESIDLQAGQVLLIPPASAWPGASPFWVVHQVVEGDTLLGITDDYGVDYVAFVSVNDLSEDDILNIGQALILPLEAPVDVVLAERQQPEPPAVVAVAPQPTPQPPAAVAAADPAVQAPAAAPTEVPTEAPAVVAVAPVGEVSDWEAEVLQRINAIRAENGLPPYQYNPLLAQAARLHAADCQQRGSCNHTGSDGSTVRVRVARTGYPMVGAAECIVYSDSPANAVAWWMDEVPPNDAHRRTLLNNWVTEIGIAVVPIDASGKYFYFIADFGRPSN